MGRTLASLPSDPVVMVGWDLGGVGRLQYIRSTLLETPLVGLPLWKFYDILKHTKNFIFNVLSIGYMYT